MKYTLVNLEGCIMDTIETTSFAKARKYFNSKFEGKYTIFFGDDRKNVILK